MTKEESNKRNWQFIERHYELAKNLFPQCVDGSTTDVSKLDAKCISHIRARVDAEFKLDAHSGRALRSRLFALKKYRAALTPWMLRWNTRKAKTAVASSSTDQ